MGKNDQGTGGESYRTFTGMYEWVKRARPAFVLLENVCGAPWMDMAASFEEIGYDATWRKVDSKFYYIPHTRERGYLIAINRDRPNGEDTSSTKVGACALLFRCSYPPCILTRTHRICY